jgi:DedD protein
MARTVSDEEQQLKRRARRRLVGAIVLVTAVVVVLPMLLDSEPKPVSEDVAVTIPSPDSGAFTPKAAPPLDQPAVKPKPRAVAPAPSSVDPQPAERRVAAPTPAPAKPAPKREPARTGPYAVQVIALADADRARTLQQKIAAAGIRSYTEVVKTEKGDVTRVRAGPFATREDAEKARERLKALGFSGNITTR